jgi:rRNA maturation endonuclease Nob1
MYRLEQMLMSGKLDALMDRNRAIKMDAAVRPVKRGKWTRIDYEPHGHDYKCSACGWKNDMPTHFCPNCGADMRGEDDV